jgi:hypothetical protein
MMVVGQGINIMNHVGLFDDAKNHVFCDLYLGQSLILGMYKIGLQQNP